MSATATSQRPPEDPEIAHLADARRRRPPGLLQFSLGTLLMLMTLVSVAAALAVAVPPLGGWFMVVGSLALIRTFVECRRFLVDGRQVLLGDKLNSFLGSLGYSFLALVSALIVFGFLSLFAGGLAGLAQWIAMELGGRGAGNLALSLAGLALMLVVLGATAMTFCSLYWKTISPRLTLDSPRSRQSGRENAAR